MAEPMVITGQVVEFGLCYDDACGGATADMVIETEGRRMRIVGFRPDPKFNPPMVSLAASRVRLTLEAVE